VTIEDEGCRLLAAVSFAAHCCYQLSSIVNHSGRFLNSASRLRDAPHRVCATSVKVAQRLLCTGK
jgi:hypothetical protein